MSEDKRGELRRESDRPVDPDRYTEAFLEILASADEAEAVLAGEKLCGLGLWASLEPHPQERRLLLIRSDDRFKTWGLYERLLERCMDVGFADPAAAVDVAHLALAVAEGLDPRRHGPERVADLRAGALAALGNAKRRAADFAGAERALLQAGDELRQGTGDPVGEAVLLSFQASLEKDLGDFEGAVHTLERSIELCRYAKDLHLWGRALIKQAEAIGYVDPEKGVALAQEGLALVDAAREPRLELCGRHALAVFLNDSGRPREALVMVEMSRPLYAQFRDPWTRLRLHWLEGKIARSLGHHREAEATFEGVWREMDALALRFELTLVSIDLAEVYVAQGKAWRAVQLVREIYPLLREWGLHQEGLAVWIILRDALAADSVRSEAFRRTAEYMRRAWFRPMEERTTVS